MEKKEIINILIVSLNDRFSKNIATNLASNLNMFFSDCYELVVYDLINPKEVLEKCGLEYLKRREKNVLENCAEYTNTVFSINFDYIKEHLSIFDKSLIIYLDLPENKVTKVANKIDYANRSDFLKVTSDIVIKIDKCLIKKTTSMILNKLGELYENS